MAIGQNQKGKTEHSAVDDGSGAIADVPFPTANYQNILTLPEGVPYAPTDDGDPGWAANLPRYQFSVGILYTISVVPVWVCPLTNELCDVTCLT